MLIQKKMEMPKLHNYFEFKVIDATTGEINQEARAENVVLDQIYHRIMGSTLYSGGQGIAYGDGVGVISPLRTSLFNQTGVSGTTGRTIDITPDLVTISGKMTLAESDYVGGYIREVGLYVTPEYNQTMLMTHAAIEDSEGNPISIGPKTNTQIIEIFFTLFIRRGEGMSLFPNAFSNSFTHIGILGSSIHNPTIEPQGIGIGGANYSNTTKTFTTNVKRLSTEEGNSPGAILSINNSVLDSPITFPNEAVFPTYTFAEREVGAGDGVNRGFNLTPGLLKPGSETVKVNGVLKTRGVDYITLTCGPSWRLNQYPLPYGGKVPKIYNTDMSREKLQQMALPSLLFMVDYEENVWVEKLYISGGGGSNRAYEVFASLDGSSWVQVASGNPSSDTFDVNLTEGGMYRYFWFRLFGSYYNVSEFDIYGAPNILFHTAPPNGAVITAKWDVDVPPKDNKLFYDVQVAYTATW